MDLALSERRLLDVDAVGLRPDTNAARWMYSLICMQFSLIFNVILLTFFAHEGVFDFGIRLVYVTTVIIAASFADEATGGVLI